MWIFPMGCWSLRPASTWVLFTAQSPGMDCSSFGCPWATVPVRKSAPMWARHKLQLPSGHVHLLWHVVLLALQCGYLLHCVPSQAAGRQPVSPWSSPQVARESLRSCLQRLPPLLHCLGVCGAVSLTFFSFLSQLLRDVFYPFLNMSSWWYC